ncbi:hypothetical protein EJB05_19899 [Eragrostis curvula]|uniref:Uncharacterized protein n=1 Tax=Eragrostis curvula TaxID=38414 RepID=A0A5J9UWW3_9POAL|nr:hypothetical protein EJB05_19899 [Eragrostis curvula]
MSLVGIDAAGSKIAAAAVPRHHDNKEGFCPLDQPEAKFISPLRNHTTRGRIAGARLTHLKLPPGVLARRAVMTRVTRGAMVSCQAM